MSEGYSTMRQPVILGDKSLGQVTREVCAPMEARPGAAWWAAFLASLTLLLVGAGVLVYGPRKR